MKPRKAAINVYRGPFKVQASPGIYKTFDICTEPQWWEGFAVHLLFHMNLQLNRLFCQGGYVQKKGGVMDREQMVLSTVFNID